jgi:hypothetical protein
MAIEHVMGEDAAEETQVKHKVDAKSTEKQPNMNCPSAHSGR